MPSLSTTGLAPPARTCLAPPTADLTQPVLSSPDPLERITPNRACLVRPSLALPYPMASSQNAPNDALPVIASRNLHQLASTHPALPVLSRRALLCPIGINPRGTCRTKPALPASPDRALPIHNPSRVAVPCLPSSCPSQPNRRKRRRAVPSLLDQTIRREGSSHRAEPYLKRHALL